MNMTLEDIKNKLESKYDVHFRYGSEDSIACTNKKTGEIFTVTHDEAFKKVAGAEWLWHWQSSPEVHKVARGAVKEYQDIETMFVYYMKPADKPVEQIKLF